MVNSNKFAGSAWDARTAQTPAKHPRLLGRQTSPASSKHQTFSSTKLAGRDGAVVKRLAFVNAFVQNGSRTALT
jgi:hypothetical protein